MKFNVGDIIEVEKEFFFRPLSKLTRGTLGKVVELRTYHSNAPTHYVVKFTCFTIPHIYGRYIIEESCKLYKIKR